ncbi:MAG: adenylosuccinate lyase [Elusimicrobiaceae bacterium]|nr:adenylosuccinate lyase [Elusimicrobiaceae bacterium]
MTTTPLSPLDGRYATELTSLSQTMGEDALLTARVRTELTWLSVLCNLKLPGVKKLTAAEQKILTNVCNLSAQDLALIRSLETTGYKNIPATRHDVKAVEYFLRVKLAKTPLKDRLPFIHFALTSEDVNSVSYALLLSDGVEKALLPALEKLQKALWQLSKKEARSVLLARTHGQPAVPTTFGKEIRVFETRLARQIRTLKQVQISCKFGGAVGNFNAHYAAFPSANWPRAAHQVLSTLNTWRKLKLFLIPVTKQVDNRDAYAELFDNLRRINVILTGFARDMWHYISAGLVTQQTVKGEVGSSTMPQKVNPIDFENAEGNLQLSAALLDFLSNKLPISRLQRDLSDSTVLRNMPVAFGHALVAYESLLKGLGKIAFNKEAARAELAQHPEVLAEAIQTILRAYGCQNAYELLRDFTRGRHLTASALTDFIDGLNIPASVKMQLHMVEAETYVGLAPQLAEETYDCFSMRRPSRRRRQRQNCGLSFL